MFQSQLWTSFLHDIVMTGNIQQRYSDHCLNQRYDHDHQGCQYDLHTLMMERRVVEKC